MTEVSDNSAEDQEPNSENTDKNNVDNDRRPRNSFRRNRRKGHQSDKFLSGQRWKLGAYCHYGLKVTSRSELHMTSLRIC